MADGVLPKSVVRGRSPLRATQAMMNREGGTDRCLTLRNHSLSRRRLAVIFENSALNNA